MPGVSYRLCNVPPVPPCAASARWSTYYPEEVHKWPKMRDRALVREATGAAGPRYGSSGEVAGLASFPSAALVPHPGIQRACRGSCRREWALMAIPLILRRDFPARFVISVPNPNSVSAHRRQFRRGDADAGIPPGLVVRNDPH